MSYTKPQNLEAWVKSLGNVRLPVPRASHERVCAAIGDSRRSLRDIAERMQESPALVLNVMREANVHSTGGMTEPAESLEIAVNRLGLKRTGELLEALPVAEFKDIPLALRQMQLISQHATQQANGLFAARLARLWQEIHWGSLLFLSPLWPLAMTEPKLVEEWELRVVHKGEPALKVERELFGTPLLDICKGLAEYWKLPAWVLQGYRALVDERRSLACVMQIARDMDPLHQQRRLDARPELRRWLNQPANTILLANGLALAAQQAWDTSHVLRWERLISLYTQTPLDDIQQQVHQQAAQSARVHPAAEAWHPAQALIWPWSARRVHRAQLPAPGPTAEQFAQWRKHCAELLVEPSPFNNAMHLTSFARDALVACGLQRVMLLMIDKSGTQLRVHQIAGLPKPAADLTLTLAQSPILAKLAGQAGQLKVTEANNAQFSAHVPASLRVLFRGENLLVRSLSSNDRVVMLLIADQGGGVMSEITVQAFGKTAQCIERALTRFSNRSQ